MFIKIKKECSEIFLKNSWKNLQRNFWGKLRKCWIFLKIISYSSTCNAGFYSRKFAMNFLRNFGKPYIIRYLFLLMNSFKGLFPIEDTPVRIFHFHLEIPNISIFWKHPLLLYVQPYLANLKSYLDHLFAYLNHQSFLQDRGQCIDFSEQAPDSQTFFVDF